MSAGQDNSPLMSAFATDLPHLLRPPVALWVYGHTHFSVARKLASGTRLVSNQRGYASNTAEGQGFDPCLVFSV